MTDCTPEQCIGLALYLGSEGWGAFCLDNSDLQESDHPTAKAFHQRMTLSAATYDEGGELRFDTDKQRGHAFNQMQRRLRAPAISDESARVHAANYRRTTPAQQRSDELAALYERDESKLPAALVLAGRRARLRGALESAASRLAAKARQGGL